MSYYTSFNLSVEGGETQNIIKDLHSAYEVSKIALDINGNREDRTYWYNHEKDMTEFSKRYPKILFTLYGEGEDNKDMWREYFKNGKCHTIFANVSFDDFDESMLN